MVLQTTAFPFGHPSERENRIFSFQTTKSEARTESEPQLRKSGSAPKFSFGFLLRFWERETAPAGSLLAKAIIGELSFCRFGATCAIRAHQVHA